MSSLRLEIADDAERDIRSILRFTRTTWGERQQRAYARQITGAMERLTRFPDLGKSRENISPGLRARPVGQHVLYYRVSTQAVRVLRVLHTRMDATEQFVS